MSSPTNAFFKIGDWVTKGNPQRQADFTYYMLWILFSAFAGMFILNGYRLIVTMDMSFAIWMAVGFAITSLQYFNLKNMYEMRKLRKNPKPPEEIESPEEMLAAFSDDKNKKDKTK